MLCVATLFTVFIASYTFQFMTEGPMPSDMDSNTCKSSRRVCMCWSCSNVLKQTEARGIENKRRQNWHEADPTNMLQIGRNIDNALKSGGNATESWAYSLNGLKAWLSHDCVDYVSCVCVYDCVAASFPFNSIEPNFHCWCPLLLFEFILPSWLFYISLCFFHVGALSLFLSPFFCLLYILRILWSSVMYFHLFLWCLAISFSEIV